MAKSKLKSKQEKQEEEQQQQEEEDSFKADDLEIISIGSLYEGPWTKKYWSCSRGKDRYPYPVGYHAVRAHEGSRCKMEINEGPKGPLFVITSANGLSSSGQTPNIAWDRFQKKGVRRVKTLHGKRYSCKINGSEFFGFKNPLVQRLLRELVANVNGTADRNLASPVSCDGELVTRLESRCGSLCPCPDLRAFVVQQLATSKRSKRVRNVDVRCIYDMTDGSKRLRSQLLTDTKALTSEQSGKGNERSMNPNQVEDMVANQSSLVVEKLMNVKAEVGVNIAKDDFSDCCESKAIDKENKTVNSNHRSTGITNISTDEEPLDRLKDGLMLKSDSSTAKEEKNDETSSLKDSEDSNMAVLFALDTFDNVQVAVADYSCDNGHITLGNSDDKPAAPAVSEGMVSESIPDEVVGTDNSNWGSEIDSVGQDVAKSMMTVLLPQAVPLLKTFRREKRVKRGSTHLSTHSVGTAISEENNEAAAYSNNELVDSMKDFVIMAADPVLTDAGCEHGNLMVPDSLDSGHDNCGNPDISNKDDTGVRENPHPLNKLNSLPYKEFHEDSSNVSRHACMSSQNELAPYPANMDIDATMFEAPLVQRDIRVHMDNPQEGMHAFITTREADAAKEEVVHTTDVSFFKGKCEGPLSESFACKNLGNSCASERAYASGNLAISESAQITHPVYDDNISNDGISETMGEDQSCKLRKDKPINAEGGINIDPVQSPNQQLVCLYMQKNKSGPSASSDYPTEKSLTSVNKDLTWQDSNPCSKKSVSSQKLSADFMNDKMPATREDQAGSYQVLCLDKRLEGTVVLKGCYFHPLPILAIMLSLYEDGICICVVCGLLSDKVSTLFLYELLDKDHKAGCPFLVGHSSLVFPNKERIVSSEVAEDQSLLQFAPDGKSLILLGNAKAPYCRERKIMCSCSTCASLSLEENAVRIIRLNLGYVTVVATLRTLDRVRLVLVCKPNCLVALLESGKLHIWIMGLAWSAHMEEFDLQSDDPVSPCIVGLKKIPEYEYLIVGHNGFGQFYIWDISKRVLLSRFSSHGISVRSFLPIVLVQWHRNSSITSKCNVKEHIDEIMVATNKGFSNCGAFLQLEDKEFAVWLLLSAISDCEDGSQLFCRKDSVVRWKLALLSNDMVIFGDALDSRAAVAGAIFGHGIIGTFDGVVYLWEMCTGKVLGVLHHFEGGAVQCIAADSSSGILAVSGDDGRLIVYRLSQRDGGMR